MVSDKPNGISHREIMIVEDNTSDLKFMTNILKNADYRVRATGDGELALRSVRVKSPDLILLDIKLPGMSGVEVCRQLKADPQTRDIPVIFISAMGESDLKMSALKAGGVDYVAKPINASEVLVRINNQLTLYQLQQKLARRTERLMAEIEERKRIEQELHHHRKYLEELVEERTATLRDSEERCRATFMGSPSAIIISEGESGIWIDVNQSALGMFGYTREEAIGKSALETNLWVDLNDRQRLVAALDRGEAVRNQEVRLRRKDGRLITASLSIRALELKGVKHLFFIMEDITERVKTEQRYQMLFKEMLEGFALHEIICDDEGHPVDYRFLSVNPAFERLTGLKGKAVIGKTVLEVMPETEPYWIKKYGRVALTGEPDAFESYSQVLDRYYQVSAFRYDRNQFACIFLDTSARKKNEARLQQAQKMEAIGLLAGGIAHDFNNILFPITGLSELLLDDLPPDSLEHENTRQILKAAERGGDLVQQILSFSRHSDHKMIPLRIQYVIKEVLKLIRSTIPSNIRISQDIQGDCGLITGDPSQMHQIAMNLITNAYHAVEQAGGEISVHLEETTLGPENLLSASMAPGPYAILSISDTGHGIDPGHLDKIFEPYFTTKKQGKGTGLGLAVVYGIVRKHGGDIRVRSEVGKGSTFKVYLPLMEKLSESESVKMAEPHQRGTERILLVDDEESIARLEKMILERLGYQVTTLTGSVEALDVFKANPHGFDLIVTDMAMPELTGDQLAIKSMAIRPNIPVILCTGFTQRIDAQAAEALGIKGFLKKPMSISKIAQTIREVLDGDDIFKPKNDRRR